ncbi:MULTISPECIES: glycosyltransferase [Sphingobacterium]|uniref:glycosyltransferase n=1 Tax=Sphingobacterium TaxID=28453 RepID=UPI00257C8D21|nr:MULTISPECIES: glycosyltransferase [Sphingobacterium]
MKVLQLNVYNFRKGGSEAVFFNTIELLEMNGHKVSTFSLKWNNNLQSNYSRFFPDSKETRKGKLKPIKDIINYFYNFESARKLEQLILEEKPDIAHVHLIWGQISSSILPVLKHHSIPIIFSIHDYRIICPAYTFKNGNNEICEKCEGNKFYNCISNKCTKDSYILSSMMASEQYFRNIFFNPAKYIDGFIYVSSFAKKMHEKYMPQLKNKANVVLYNFADEIVLSEKKSNGDKFFLYYGRLSHEKGLKTLIEAFALLDTCKLKIVGTGPLEEELIDFVEKRALRNIEFLGYKSGYELENIVKNAYFIIVPSEWYENNPMTIVEGYSNATPVIGASIGGIPEIIEDNKTGYLFKPKNVQELVEVIKLANNLDPEDYRSFSFNALQFAKRYFNKQIYYQELINFYKRLKYENSNCRNERNS